MCIQLNFEIDLLKKVLRSYLLLNRNLMKILCKLHFKVGYAAY